VKHALIAAVPAMLAACGGGAKAPMAPVPAVAEATFPVTYDRPADFEFVVKRSQYVRMRDGVRLAVDVTLPKGLPDTARVPVVLFQTRYWRAMQIRFPYRMFVSSESLAGIVGTIRDYLVRRGYGWVDVDVRGSGASFGNRPWDYAPDEIRDAGDLADWIIAQKWSDGHIVTAGASYTGSTAEFSLINRHPAIVGTINLSSEYDQFTDILLPGGIPLSFYLDEWGSLTDALDRNRIPDPDWKARLALDGVALAGTDSGSELRARALREHAANYDFRDLKSVTYRDDFLAWKRSTKSADSATTFARAAAESSSFAWLTTKFGPDFRSLGVDVASQHAYVADLTAAKTPYYAIAGWFDGAYANAMIHRFRTFNRPGVQLLIGPWDHHQIKISPVSGGGASSFALPNELLRFLDARVGGRAEASRDDAPVRYYVLGAEQWRTAQIWPVPSIPWRLQLGGGRTLQEQRDSSVSEASDRYDVDFTAGTGRDTRWNTLMGRGLRTPYTDRARRDSALLVYETAPLAEGREVTGHPAVDLHLRSNSTDGAVFVYLEDVAPDGRVTMVTEGQLRLLHRRASSEPSPYWIPGPYRTFKKKDAEPMTPGEAIHFTMELLPTSWCFGAGHRVRVAIAGADRDHFARIPADTSMKVSLEILRGAKSPSAISLPVASSCRLAP
jgi:putative CocE/NonD family hydrolase